MELLPFVIIIPIIVAGIIISAASNRSRWEKIGNELGLRTGGIFEDELTGSIEGFPIRVKEHKESIEVILHGRNAFPNSIRLNGEGVLRNMLSGTDIEIGCPRFDARTHVSSYSNQSETMTAALLDAQTRNGVSRVVVSGGAKVQGGEISINTKLDVDQVASVVQSFVRLAQHLRMEKSEIPARLAANALQDPVAAVQLHNLSLLLQFYGNKREAVETCRRVLQFPEPAMRLVAAIHLGQEGIPLVRKIARSRRASADVRVKALRHLLSNDEPARVIEIATDLLEDQPPMVRRVAIQCLGRLQHAPSLDALTSLFDNTSDAATALEVITALRRIGDPAAEGALMRALGRRSDRVKTAAIEALAELGTVRAVEPLHALAGKRKFKRIARAAIDAIQSRLGKVEAGRLSLAPTIDPEGGLSVVGDPEKAGGLSLEDGH